MRRHRNQNNCNTPGPGPLMTGHLQDIDLELELLKRKREMIEQQQQLLVMEQQFKTGRHYDSYDQMRYDKSDDLDLNRDYNYSHNNGPKQHNQFSRKRPAEPQWQYDGFPKRLPKKKGNQSQFYPRQGQGNAGPANSRKPGPGPSHSPKASPRRPPPLMNAKVKLSVGQKIVNQKQASKPPQKEFTPNKVTKGKASPAPNKIASQPLAERKNLVNAANESVLKSDVSRMLLPDRIPTQQVSGRLELALGAIMKNIREVVGVDSPRASMLRSMQMQRVMKQAVRERIRTVMLGKVVGNLTEILAVYREEFPPETDLDIVNIALEAAGVAAEPEQKTNIIDSENPEEFYKENMSILLDTTLNEMFGKLEEIYGVVTPPEAAAAPENKEEKNDTLLNSATYRGFMNMDIKPRDVKHVLPRLLKKYIPYITKLLNLDAMFQSTEAGIIMKANQKAATYIDKNAGASNSNAAKTGAGAETPKEGRHYNLPYYVKIMGRPSLPKRKIMQAFLNEFNPKSIKKHRSIFNLLFVGFSEKSDFDRIVGADGTIIGRSTISVRVCSNTARDPATEQNGKTNDVDFAKDVSGDVKNESAEGEIISADLDCQINDLLSSIRKSEEEDDTTATGEKTDEHGNNSSDDKTEAVAQENENSQIDDSMGESDNVGNDNTAETPDNTGDKDVETPINTIQENVEDENAANENAEDEIYAEEENAPEETAEGENPTPDENTNETEEADAESSNTGNSEVKTDNQEDSESPSKIEEQSDLKSNASGRSTPSRISARLANVTPSTIRTRRASRLNQN